MVAKHFHFTSLGSILLKDKNMANEYELMDFLEEDSEEFDDYKTDNKYRRLSSREESDPFNLENTEFIKRYRLSKELVQHLCLKLAPLMKTPNRRTDISVKTKVLIALSYYATGSYQRITGNSEGHSVSQQAVNEITRCLNDCSMRQKYVHFPINEQERNKIKTQFYTKFGIPGVLGCIDCTQVAIIRPAIHEERFYCRKHYHALNVQLICDAEMNILSVHASHGGASHDSYIWTNHPLKIHLDNLRSSENTWFLGDSGYPLRETMMTPILNAAPDTPEAHYTNLHVRARNVIERTIGLLKARFRCLLVHKVMRYTPEMAGSIVNACAILHNICNRANVPVEQLNEEDMLREIQFHHVVRQQINSSNVALQRGLSTRNHLVQLLWERRQTRN